MTMTSNHPTAKKKQNWLWKGTKAVGKGVYKTCVVGMEFTTDTRETLCRSVNVILKTDPEAFIRYRALGSTGYETLYDWNAILKATDFASERSCQRGILELCALKMSAADRRKLLASHGFTSRDELFRKLRRRVIHATGEVIYTKDRLMRQQWYDKVEEGKRRAVSTLYQIIKKNPTVFTNMVGC